ncbi:MAG: cation:proton antiporter [Acidimicrobiia bacterium]
MSDFGLALVALSFVLYALISRRLSRSPITGPMIFVVAGILIGPGSLDALDVSVASQGIGLLLEFALVVVLFTDAVAIDLRALRQESFVPGRLLGIGLPLTVAAGLGTALLLFTGLGFWEAAVLAVVLAPTDAALGQAVVTNRRVPRLVRQGLNIESGLNDGLAVPVLTVFLAQAQIDAGLMSEAEIGRVFLEEIGIAAVIGTGVGYLGGKAVVFSSHKGWMGPIWRGLSVTALALLCFGVADPLGGSGFIAAFVGGVTFGAVARSAYPDVGDHAEGVAHLLTMLSFFVFGALMLGPSLSELDASVAVYAVLSLSLVRLIPVRIAMIRSDVRPRTVGYLGWFGPRGLASLVFAVTIVLDSGLPNTDLIILILTATVGLSVFAHGATAWPASVRYADWYEGQEAEQDEMMESAAVAHMGERRRVHPHWEREAG